MHLWSFVRNMHLSFSKWTCSDIGIKNSLFSSTKVLFSIPRYLYENSRIHSVVRKGRLRLVWKIHFCTVTILIWSIFNNLRFRPKIVVWGAVINGFCHLDGIVPVVAWTKAQMICQTAASNTVCKEYQITNCSTNGNVRSVVSSIFWMSAETNLWILVSTEIKKAQICLSSYLLWG